MSAARETHGTPASHESGAAGAGAPPTQADAGATPYFAAFVKGRRGQILDAALAVFGEHGYSGGTMRQIAARLGVTEPALYRHYAGKQAIFEDLVARAGDHIVAFASDVVRGLDPADLRGSLALLLEARREQQASGAPVIRMLLVAAPHSGLFVRTFRAHLAAPMAALLAEAVPRIDAVLGLTFTAEQTTGRVRAFISLFVGHFMTSMVLGEPASDESVVTAMLAIMGWERG